MKRRTENARLAMNRLAEHVGTKVEKVAGGYLLTNGGNSVLRPKSAKKCLAHMVLVAQFMEQSGGQGMTRSEVRDVIRLTRVTSHGTVGHEEEAIREVLTR